MATNRRIQVQSLPQSADRNLLNRGSTLMIRRCIRALSVMLNWSNFTRAIGYSLSDSRYPCRTTIRITLARTCRAAVARSALLPRRCTKNPETLAASALLEQSEQRTTIAAALLTGN